MPEGLVQTVLSPDLLEWVKTEAKASGLTIAAWLRRLVMQERDQAIVAAWVMPAAQSRTHLHLLGSGGQPDFLLQRTQIHPDGSQEFRVNLRETGDPYTQNHFYSRAILLELLRQKIQDGWFALDGSLDAWDLVNSYSDLAAEGQMIFILKPDRQKKSA